MMSQGPMSFRLVAGYETRAPTLAEYIEAGKAGTLPPARVSVPKWFVFTSAKPVPPMEVEFSVEPIAGPAATQGKDPAC